MVNIQAPLTEPDRTDLGPSVPRSSPSPESKQHEIDSEYCIVNTYGSGGSEVEIEVEVEAPEAVCPVSAHPIDAQTQTQTSERHQGAADFRPDPEQGLSLKSLVVRVGGRAGSSVRGLIEADTACLVRWIGSMILAETAIEAQTQTQEPSPHSPSTSPRTPPPKSAFLEDPAPSPSPSSSSSCSTLSLLAVEMLTAGDELDDADLLSSPACCAADAAAVGDVDTDALHHTTPTPAPTGREIVSRKEGREMRRESQEGRGGDRPQNIEQQQQPSLEGSRCWSALQQGTRDSCLAAIRSLRYQMDPCLSPSSSSSSLSIPTVGLDSVEDRGRERLREREKGRSSGSGSGSEKNMGIDHRDDGSISSNSNGSMSTAGAGADPLGESYCSDCVADLSNRLLSLLSADMHCLSLRSYLSAPSIPVSVPVCLGSNGSRPLGKAWRGGHEELKYEGGVESEDEEEEVEVEAERSFKEVEEDRERRREWKRERAAELLMASLQQYSHSDGDGIRGVSDRGRDLELIPCLRSHIRVCIYVLYCTALHCTVLNCTTLQC